MMFSREFCRRSCRLSTTVEKISTVKIIHYLREKSNLNACFSYFWAIMGEVPYRRSHVDLLLTVLFVTVGAVTATL